MTPLESPLAHLLVVGLDDFDHLPLEAQIANSEKLREAVSLSDICVAAQRQGNLLVFPNDEGLILVCPNDLTLPLYCAEDIGEILTKQLGVKARMGIHSGTVHFDTNASGSQTVYGDALLLTRRIMQQGEAGHILLSQYVAERLYGGSVRNVYWANKALRVGTLPLESGAELTLFNLHTKRAGNPLTPARLRDELKGQVRAHVLFMDIVSFTQMRERQTAVLNELYAVVRGTAAYQRAVREDALVCCPTGDGMALAFFNDLLAPLQCAGAIALSIKDHPSLKLRMGIHTGLVDRIANMNAVDQQLNDVNGEGIITARRVMDAADNGHILLSEAAAKSLLPLESWRRCLRLLGVCRVKHDEEVKLYNFWTKDFGNRATPKSMRSQELQEIGRYVPPPPRYYAPEPAPASKATLATVFQLLIVLLVGGTAAFLLRNQLANAAEKWRPIETPPERISAFPGERQKPGDAYAKGGAKVAGGKHPRPKPQKAAKNGAWKTDAQPLSVPLPTTEDGETNTETETSAAYTGVIIDALGQGVERSMSPKIRRADGGEIWGTLDVTPDFVIENGIVSYAHSVEEARKIARVGANPLVIRAQSHQGEAFKTDALLTDADADALFAADAHGKFLSKCCVVFVIDGDK